MSSSCRNSFTCFCTNSKRSPPHTVATRRSRGTLGTSRESPAPRPPRCGWRPPRPLPLPMPTLPGVIVASRLASVDQSRGLVSVRWAGDIWTVLTGAVERHIGESPQL